MNKDSTPQTTTVHRDWTEGSIVSNLWSLSWPMLINYTLNALGPTIDMIWVGTLGASAIAGVGISGLAVMVVNSLISGLFTGTIALVARRIGAGMNRAPTMPHNRLSSLVWFFLCLWL